MLKLMCLLKTRRPELDPPVVQIRQTRKRPGNPTEAGLEGGGGRGLTLPQKRLGPGGRRAAASGWHAPLWGSRKQQLGLPVYGRLNLRQRGAGDWEIRCLQQGFASSAETKGPPQAL